MAYTPANASSSARTSPESQYTLARVAALAAPGEVLVSQTVRDLVAGSGLEFEERGLHTLKGVPNEWLLFRALPN